MVLLIIFWIALSLIVASYVGEHRSTGFAGTLMICLIFSPLIGLLIAGFSEKRSESSVTKYKHLKKAWDTNVNKAKLYEEQGEAQQAIDAYMAALLEIRNYNNGNIPIKGNLHSVYREVEDKIRKLKG